MQHTKPHLCNSTVTVYSEEENALGMTNHQLGWPSYMKNGPGSQIRTAYKSGPAWYTGGVCIILAFIFLKFSDASLVADEVILEALV